jgi:hypothetical protein
MTNIDFPLPLLHNLRANVNSQVFTNTYKLFFPSFSSTGEEIILVSKFDVIGPEKSKSTTKYYFQGMPQKSLPTGCMGYLITFQVIALN